MPSQSFASLAVEKVELKSEKSVNFNKFQLYFFEAIVKL